MYQCWHLFEWINAINVFDHFIADQASQAEVEHLTEQLLEESIDKALAKADYNWDGYISWNEYVYSLGDSEVSKHVKTEYDIHEVDHKHHWSKHPIRRLHFR